MDLLVLGSCEHGSDSNEMKVLDLKSGRAALEIGVHEVLASEEGFLAHLVRGEHFYHPVHHFGAQRAVDFVPGEDVGLRGGGLAEMHEDVLGVIPADLVGVGSFEFLSEGTFGETAN